MWFLDLISLRHRRGKQKRTLLLRIFIIHHHGRLLPLSSTIWTPEESQELWLRLRTLMLWVTLKLVVDLGAESIWKLFGVSSTRFTKKNPETCRTQTRITADFDLALGVAKQKTLHIESVRVPPVNWAGSCTALSCRSHHQQQQNWGQSQSRFTRE